MTGFPILQESPEISMSFVVTLSVWDAYKQPLPFTHKQPPQSPNLDQLPHPVWLL